MAWLAGVSLGFGYVPCRPMFAASGLFLDWSKERFIPKRWYQLFMTRTRIGTDCFKKSSRQVKKRWCGS